VLKETFGEKFKHSHLSLSIDIKEMQDEIALTLHNIPDQGKQI